MPVLHLALQVEEEGLDHSQSIGTGTIVCTPCCSAA